MEQWTQATLVARLEQEQGNFRRTLTRIRAFRETSFVASGYLLTNLITNLRCVGLVLPKIEPSYESRLPQPSSRTWIDLSTLVQPWRQKSGQYRPVAPAAA
jgi:hypothetical protein